MAHGVGVVWAALLLFACLLALLPAAEGGLSGDGGNGRFAPDSGLPDPADPAQEGVPATPYRWGYTQRLGTLDVMYPRLAGAAHPAAAASYAGAEAACGAFGRRPLFFLTSEEHDAFRSAAEGGGSASSAQQMALPLRWQGRRTVSPAPRGVPWLGLPVWTSLVVLGGPVGPVWQGVSQVAWRPAAECISAGEDVGAGSSRVQWRPGAGFEYADSAALGVIACRAVGGGGVPADDAVPAGGRDASTLAILARSDDASAVSDLRFEQVLEPQYRKGDTVAFRLQRFYSVSDASLHPLNYGLEVELLAKTWKKNANGGFTVNSNGRVRQVSFVDRWDLPGLQTHNHDGASKPESNRYNMDCFWMYVVPPLRVPKGGSYSITVDLWRDVDVDPKWRWGKKSKTDEVRGVLSFPPYFELITLQTTYQFHIPGTDNYCLLEKLSKRTVIVITVDVDTLLKSRTIRMWGTAGGTVGVTCGPFNLQSTPPAMEVDSTRIGQDIGGKKNWFWFRRFALWSRLLSAKEVYSLLADDATNPDNVVAFAKPHTLPVDKPTQLRNLLRYGSEGDVLRYGKTLAGYPIPATAAKWDHTDVTIVFPSKTASTSYDPSSYSTVSYQAEALRDNRPSDPQCPSRTYRFGTLTCTSPSYTCYSSSYKWLSRTPQVQLELEEMVLPLRVLIWSASDCSGTFELFTRSGYSSVVQETFSAQAVPGCESPSSVVPVQYTDVISSIRIRVSAKCQGVYAVAVEGRRLASATLPGEIGQLGLWKDNDYASTTRPTWFSFNRLSDTSGKFMEPAASGAGFTICLRAGVSSLSSESVSITFESGEVMTLTLGGSSASFVWRGVSCRITSKCSNICGVIDADAHLMDLIGDGLRACREESSNLRLPPDTASPGVRRSSSRCTVSMFTRALSEEEARRLQLVVDTRRIVQGGSVYSPLEGGNRVMWEWSAVGGLIEKYWCRSEGGSAYVDCNAFGSGDGVWAVPAVSTAYFHVAVNSPEKQNVVLRFSGSPEVEVFVRREGYGVHISKSTAGPASDPECRLFQPKGRLSVDQLPDSCVPRTVVVELLAGWNSIILEAVNLEADDDGFAVDFQPKAHAVSFSFTAPPHSVLYPESSLGEIKVKAVCNGDQFTATDTNGTGSITFKSSCRDVAFTVDDKIRSEVFQISSVPTHFAVKSRTLPEKVDTTDVLRWRAFEITLEAQDADNELTVFTNDSVTINTQGYSWQDIHKNEWDGSLHGHVFEFKDGLIKLVMFFRVDGVAIFNFFSVGLGNKTLEITVLNHSCTDATCASGNACDKQYGCLCNQNAGSGYFDRLTGCMECLRGYAGPRCTFVCPGMPHETVCGGHGTCDDGVGGNGLCQCSTDSGFWLAPECTNCMKNYWGADCLAKCDCQHACDDGVLGTGKCICEDEGRDSGCKNCKAGYAELSGKCEPCPGKCTGRGTCTAGTANGEPVLMCVCNLDEKGRLRYVGSNCGIECQLFNGEVCGGSTKGTCGPKGCSCIGNFRGDACELCPSHLLGTACDVACPAPVCATGNPLDCGTMLPCSGHGTCSLLNDTAAECTCSELYVGDGCEFLCPSLAGEMRPCTVNGDERGKCESTGTEAVCTCNSLLFSGDLCETCTGCSVPVCTGCGSGGVCTLTTSAVPQCQCRVGYYGQFCDRACQCGVDPQKCGTDGACDCTSGPQLKGVLAVAIGPHCTETCPGSTDTILCSGHGECDTDTATCTCSASDRSGHWDGEDCSICDEGWFPPESCNRRCDNNATHNAVTGECQCTDEYKGPTCSVHCVRGTYDESTGICHCKPTAYGDGCEKQCDDDCTDTTLFGEKRVCGPSGTCECSDRWTGADCGTCKETYWGTQCEYTCCNRHGRCNEQGGSCKCFADEARGFWDGPTCAVCLAGYRSEKTGCKERGLVCTSLRSLKPTGPPPSNWALHRPGIRLVDAKSGTVVVGGPSLLTAVSPEEPAELHSILSLDDIPLHSLSCSFVHVYDTPDGKEEAALLYTSSLQRTVPRLERCAWKRENGRAFPDFTACRRDIITSEEGRFASAVGYGPVVFAAFYGDRSILKVFDTQPPAQVHATLEEINDVAVVGKRLLVAGKLKGHWDIEMFDLASLMQERLSGTARDYILPVISVNTKASWRAAASDMDYDTGKALCHPADTLGQDWVPGHACTPQYLRKVSRIAPVGDDGFVAALQGNFGEAKVAKFDISSGRATVAELADDITTELGTVNSIAVDLPGDQVFVNHLTSSRGLLHRVQLSDFRLRGRSVVRFLSIAVQQSNRLLWGLDDAGQPVLTPMLLSAVETITPTLAHITGGAIITVTGMAFVQPTDSPAAECQFHGDVIPALSFTSTSMLCEAPLSTACVSQTVTISLSRKRGRFTDDTRVQLLRIALPRLLRSDPYLSPDTTEGPSARVILEGKDMFATPYAVCRFWRGKEPEEGLPLTRVTFDDAGGYVKATCSTGVPDPYAVDVSLDGAVFSQPVVFLGKAAKIRASFDLPGGKVTAAVVSGGLSAIPPIHVSLVSADGVKLGYHARHDYEVKVLNTPEWTVDRPNDTRIVQPPPLQVSPSSTQQGCRGSAALKLGEGWICGLFFAHPPAGIVSLTIAQRDAPGIPNGLASVAVSVLVIPGVPHAIELLKLQGGKPNESTLFIDGSVEVSVMVRDQAGNPVGDIPKCSAFFISREGAEWRTELRLATSAIDIIEIELFREGGDAKVDISVPPPRGGDASGNPMALAADGNFSTLWRANLPPGNFSNTSAGRGAGAAVAVMPRDSQPFTLSRYSIVTPHTERAVRWRLYGGNPQGDYCPPGNAGWAELHTTSTDAITSEHVEVPSDRRQPYACYRVVLEKAIRVSGVGVPEGKGLINYKELAPDTLKHNTQYRAVFYAGPGLFLGHVVSADITTPVCPDSRHQIPLTARCGECPAEAVCNGTEVLAARDGFWRPNNSTLRFVACPLPGECPAAEETGDAACGEHSSGAMCGVCEPGFYPNFFEGRCSECPGAPRLFVVLTLSVFFCATLGLSAMHLFDFRVGAAIWIRIILDYMQLTAALAFLHDPLPNTVQTFVETINPFHLGLDEFSALRCSLPSFDGMDYYTATMAAPFIALPCAAALYTMHRIWLSRERKTFRGRDIAEAGCYSPKEGSAPLQWVDFVEEHHGTPGGAPPRLERGTNLQILSVAVGCTLYYLCMPLVRSSTLALDCADLEILPACNATASEEWGYDIPYGCTPGGLQRTHLRRGPEVLCGEGRPGFPLAATLLVLYALVGPLALGVGVILYRRSKGEAEAMRAFPLLLSGYRPGLVWGVPVILRKCSIAMVTVLVVDGSRERYFLAWIVTAAFIAQLWVRPFANRYHNWAEGAGLVCTLLVMNASLLQEAMMQHRGILTAVMVAIMACGGMWLVFCIWKYAKSPHKKPWKGGEQVPDPDDDVLSQDLWRSDCSDSLIGERFEEMAVMPTGVGRAWKSTAPQPCVMYFRQRKREVQVTGGPEHIKLGGNVIPFSDILAVDLRGESLEICLDDCNVLITPVPSNPAVAAEWADWLLREACGVQRVKRVKSVDLGMPCLQLDDPPGLLGVQGRQTSGGRADELLSLLSASGRLGGVGVEGGTGSQHSPASWNRLRGAGARSTPLISSSAFAGAADHPLRAGLLSNSVTPKASPCIRDL